MSCIPCLLQAAAQSHPKKPAVIFGNTDLSFKQLNQRVTHASQRLLKQFKGGDRIGIFSDNSADYIILLLAMIRSKIIACPLNKRLPENQISRVLNITDSKALITTSATILGSGRIRQPRYLFDHFVSHTKTSTIKIPAISSNQSSTIIFTSGSSGKPKGALHSYSNHYFSALGANANIPLLPRDRSLLTLPLYHVGGIAMLFRSLLSSSAIVIPEQKLTLSNNLQKYRITHVSLVPTQLHRLLKEKQAKTKLSKLKSVLLGGSGIPHGLLKKAAEWDLPIYKTYGLTEMSSQVATFDRPLSNHVKILKYRNLKISKTNEILVKGKTLFKGYVLKKKTSLPLTAQGWFKTGDLGSFDKKTGLTVTGRKDNMFISGGENIYPEEIEDRLCRLNTIADALIVPVADKEFGFRPAAFIKFRKLKTNKAPDLKQYLREYLPRFKVPEYFYIWPKHLTERSLKVDRMHLMNFVKKGGRDLKRFQ